MMLNQLAAPDLYLLWFYAIVSFEIGRCAYQLAGESSSFVHNLLIWDAEANKLDLYYCSPRV